MPLWSGRKIFGLLYQETTEVELVEDIAELVSARLGPIAERITFY